MRPGFVLLEAVGYHREAVEFLAGAGFLAFYFPWRGGYGRRSSVRSSK